jgi:hypothetical protein
MRRSPFLTSFIICASLYGGMYNPPVLPDAASTTPEAVFAAVSYGSSIVLRGSLGGAGALPRPVAALASAPTPLRPDRAKIFELAFA